MNESTKFVLDGFVNITSLTIKIVSIGTIDADNKTHMDITYFKLHLQHTPLKTDGRYFSPAMAYSIWYITLRWSHIKTIISLITVIKSYTRVSNIKLIK